MEENLIYLSISLLSILALWKELAQLQIDKNSQQQFQILSSIIKKDCCFIICILNLVEALELLIEYKKLSLIAYQILQAVSYLISYNIFKLNYNRQCLSKPHRIILVTYFIISVFIIFLEENKFIQCSKTVIIGIIALYAAFEDNYGKGSASLSIFENNILIRSIFLRQNLKIYEMQEQEQLKMENMLKQINQISEKNDLQLIKLNLPIISIIIYKDHLHNKTDQLQTNKLFEGQNQEINYVVFVYVTLGYECINMKLIKRLDILVKFIEMEMNMNHKEQNLPNLELIKFNQLSDKVLIERLNLLEAYLKKLVAEPQFINQTILKFLKLEKLNPIFHRFNELTFLQTQEQSEKSNKNFSQKDFSFKSYQLIFETKKIFDNTFEISITDSVANFQWKIQKNIIQLFNLVNRLDDNCNSDMNLDSYKSKKYTEKQITQMLQDFCQLFQNDIFYEFLQYDPQIAFQILQEKKNHQPSDKTQITTQKIQITPDLLQLGRQSMKNSYINEKLTVSPSTMNSIRNSTYVNQNSFANLKNSSASMIKNNLTNSQYKQEVTIPSYEVLNSNQVNFKILYDNEIFYCFMSEFESLHYDIMMKASSVDISYLIMLRQELIFEDNIEEQKQILEEYLNLALLQRNTIDVDLKTIFRQ